MSDENREMSPRTKMEFLYREVLGEVDSIVGRLEVVNENAGRQFADVENRIAKAGAVISADIAKESGEVKKAMIAAKQSLDLFSSECNRLRLALSSTSERNVNLKLLVAFFSGAALSALLLSAMFVLRG